MGIDRLPQSVHISADRRLVDVIFVGEVTLGDCRWLSSFDEHLQDVRSSLVGAQLCWGLFVRRFHCRIIGGFVRHNLAGRCMEQDGSAPLPVLCVVSDRFGYHLRVPREHRPERRHISVGHRRSKHLCRVLYPSLRAYAVDSAPTSRWSVVRVTADRKETGVCRDS